MARRSAPPNLLRAVLSGDDLATGPSRLASGEDGMISLASVLAVLFFLVLVALVGNVGVVINHKIEAQNAADAVAISSARQMARGLNAVTAANHLVGELLSLTAIQEAIGGKFHGGDEGYPDELNGRLDKLRQDADAADTNLEKQKQAHEVLMNGPAMYGRYIAWDDVRDKDQAAKGDNMLLASRVDLKKTLGDVYVVKNIALAILSLQNVPYIGPFCKAVGTVLYEAADLIEIYIEVEWQALAVFEQIAESTSGLRDQITDLLPNARQFELDVRDRMPELVSQTAKAVGERNGGLGAAFPEQDTLRLVDDPARPESGGSFPRSQAVRAAYPWVNYDRQPVLRLTRWMVFSHARDHYREWSNLMAVQKSRELYERGSFLLMIVDSGPDQKGHEIWTHEPSAAEELFTVMGFAHRPAPKIWSPGFFKAVNADGYTTFAQAMVYNANTQDADPQAGEFQPQVGWDTLNWASPVGDSAALEYPNSRDDSGCPKIRLNWQAKLVPATRLRQALADPPDAALAPALGRLDPDSPLAGTH